MVAAWMFGLVALVMGCALPPPPMRPGRAQPFLMVALAMTLVMAMPFLAEQAGRV